MKPVKFLKITCNEVSAQASPQGVEALLYKPDTRELVYQAIRIAEPWELAENLTLQQLMELIRLKREEIDDLFHDGPKLGRGSHV